MNKNEKIPAILIISGPTASGKSSMAEKLAIKYKFPVISADSRQIYRGLDIGTAKPAREIHDKIRYEMIDIISPDETFSAGKFAERAADLINNRYRDEKVIIIAGGTGFYISALMKGLATIPAIHPAIDHKWNNLLQKKGIHFLQKAIMEIDPEFARRGDIHNSHRILRALKIAEQTGKSLFSYTPQPLLSPQHPTGYFALHHERTVLYERINRRVDKMVQEGLVEEVRKLIPFRGQPALQTVGYKELFLYFDGELSFEESIRKIKQHSRNYAKRQLTWLRKHGNWTWISTDEINKITEWLENKL